MLASEIHLEKLDRRAWDIAHGVVTCYNYLIKFLVKLKWRSLNGINDLMNENGRVAGVVVEDHHYFIITIIIIQSNKEERYFILEIITS